MYISKVAYTSLLRFSFSSSFLQHSTIFNPRLNALSSASTNNSIQTARRNKISRLNFLIVQHADAVARVHRRVSCCSSLLFTRRGTRPLKKKRICRIINRRKERKRERGGGARMAVGTKRTVAGNAGSPDRMKGRLTAN